MLCGPTTMVAWQFIPEKVCFPCNRFGALYGRTPWCSCEPDSHGGFVSVVEKRKL